MIQTIQNYKDDLVAIRRDLHAHPELAFEEHRTAKIVAGYLEAWGIEVVRGVAKTGVVGVLKNGVGTRSIGLRADMDALPMHELNAFAHRSEVDGRMHACGHDGHTTMLLGAARYLAQTRQFEGTVHLVFQPAEEGGNAGAREMVREGLFERFPCDAVFGMHNWPGMPAGHFGLRPGTLMASCSEFKVTVIGQGSHAAMPHNGTDPLLAANTMIGALQAIITRNKKPMDTAVLSVTQFHGGTASNIVAGEVWFGGTIRTFTVDVLDLIEERMRQTVSGIAAAMGCTATVEVVRSLPPTVNSPKEAEFAASVLKELVGEERVDDNYEPTMGGEDFAFMLQANPGCYAFIGNGKGTHRLASHGLGPCELHNGSYDFNDEILVLGSSYLSRLAERWLAPQ